MRGSLGTALLHCLSAITQPKEGVHSVITWTCALPPLALLAVCLACAGAFSSTLLMRVSGEDHFSDDPAGLESVCKVAQL